MSATPTTAPAANNANQVKKIPGWIWTVFVILIIVGVFFTSFSVIKKGLTKATTPTETASSSKAKVIKATKYEPYLIDLTSKEVKLGVPYGIKNIRYKNITTKYCTKNRTVDWICSQDIEDISGKLPQNRSEDNLILYFKSQGEDGTMVVEFEYD